MLVNLEVLQELTYVNLKGIAENASREDKDWKAGWVASFTPIFLFVVKFLLGNLLWI